MLFLYFFTLVTISNGSSILGIIPTPSFSHQNAFWPIWKELSLRGHSVTVVTTDPMNNPELKNLTEISIRETYDIWAPLFENMKATKNLVTSNRDVQIEIRTVSKFILSHRAMATLMKNDSVFDLVMVEAHYPEFLIFGEIYRCPTVMLSSLDVTNEIHVAMGNTIHPITNPDLFMPKYRDMDFKDRLTGFMYVCFEWLFGFPRYMSDRNKVIREFFGDDVPDVSQLLDRVAMLFVNVHPALHGIRLTGPNTVQFGGMNHMRDPQPLPKDLQTFLDTSKEGVVYFSLGTNVLSKDLKSEEFNIFMQALGELPYKVLWKYELDDGNLHKPENIKFVKWLPQQDVLRHPNIKAFVTQGGLQSIEEAMYCRVPMVIIPFAVDQEQNARKAAYKQIGRAIYRGSGELSKNALKKAIKEVIEDPSYRKNIESLAEIILDEPMTGVEKVIWWSEYVIRHKGAKHLRNQNLDVPLYQYLMLDILAFVIVTLIIFSLFMVIVYKIIKCFFSIAIGCVKLKKE
ncbi:unnamed protein product [Callosobruchus maculatus]|uniref:UDP-glucuronosyltransferase n=1 Tax=Callosobruchus maculatus TaxID=64391 RepID=A0A653CXA9_CALMS|nr:unnamed protein product [Callosobruchus maculatus]